MNRIPVWAYIVVMAGVTYLVRMTPMVLLRRRIRSRFLQSFLYYVPYAVLGAMTVPGIFFSTASAVSAAAGFVTALFLSFRGKSLVVVAAAACAAAWLAQTLLALI